MPSGSRKSASGGRSSTRRIVVVAVPPVDELDLVGPLQVFRSVNRLAGRSAYAIEVVTSADCLTVEGEGGLLTFVARHHFSKFDGACDSVLLVCGLSSRSVRDAALSAWLRKKASGVRRMGAVCVGAFLLAEAGLLDGRRATAFPQACKPSLIGLCACDASPRRSPTDRSARSPRGRRDLASSSPAHHASRSTRRRAATDRR